MIGISKHVFPLSIQYLPTSKDYLSRTSGSTKLCRLAIKRLNQTFCHSEGENDRDGSQASCGVSAMLSSKFNGPIAHGSTR